MTDKQQHHGTDKPQHHGSEAASERDRQASDAAVRETGHAAREAAGRTKEALDRGVETGAEGVREAGRTAHETAARTGDLIERGGDELRKTEESVVATGKRTADAAVKVSEHVAEQGREVLQTGARAASDIQGRIADAGYGSGEDLLGSAASALGVYRAAGENSASGVQALLESWLSLGRGVQQIQHAALELMGRAVGEAGHKPQDLLRVTSLEELAQVQRDFYLDAVNHAFEASTRLLELAISAAQEAIRPLHAAESRRPAAGRGAARVPRTVDAKDD
jgi:hypothetical protein